MAKWCWQVNVEIRLAVGKTNEERTSTRLCSDWKNWRTGMANPITRTLQRCQWTPRRNLQGLALKEQRWALLVHCQSWSRHWVTNQGSLFEG